MMGDRHEGVTWHAARGITFLRDFVKDHHNGFATRSCFFHHGIGDTLRQFAFLIGGTAGQHRDLYQGHKMFPDPWLARSFTSFRMTARGSRLACPEQLSSAKLSNGPRKRGHLASSYPAKK
jgi:hypothetical protein